MSDATADDAAGSPGKGGRKGLVLGAVLALAGAGAGYAVTSGLVPLGGKAEAHVDSSVTSLAFVPLEPMTIPLGGSGERRYLRFRGELEVAEGKVEQVEAALPRVVDVLNTYFRSLKMADVEDPSALLTLRAQMRRRIDLVVGGDAVHDLLVMEFVIN